MEDGDFYGKGSHCLPNTEGMIALKQGSSPFPVCDANSSLQQKGPPSSLGFDRMGAYFPAQRNAWCSWASEMGNTSNFILIHGLTPMQNLMMLYPCATAFRDVFTLSESCLEAFWNLPFDYFLAVIQPLSSHSLHQLPDPFLLPSGLWSLLLPGLLLGLSSMPAVPFYGTHFSICMWISSTCFSLNITSGILRTPNSLTSYSPRTRYLVPLWHL